MLYAAIDIHKRTFQAAVMDLETGETSEHRFGATREDLNGLGDASEGRGGGGRDRGDERQALGVARAGRTRFRCAPGRSGAGEGVARPDQARED
jgi:hypothetical protein